VRITEQFGLNRRISPERLARVRRKVGQVVETQAGAFLGSSLPAVAFGSSGTIRAIARRYGGKGSQRLACAALPTATASFAALKGSQRRKLFPPLRADVLLAGLIILDQLCARLGISDIEAVDEGLRDGLLVAMRDAQLAKHGPPPPAGA
jgi:exopolyphosphatase/pppGpp-phosphohydrolase